MGKRTEPRAQRALTVRVLGMDATGHPILQTAWTVNISRQGVVLDGLQSRVNSGDVLSLQYKGRKVRYRVIWAGEAGTEKAGQLGLEKVNAQDDLWHEDLPPETESDPQERGKERRKQRRYQALLPVEVNASQGASTRAEISDISLSGCYVNTLFPMALDSIVTVVFWLGEQKFSANGRVRTSVLGVGCGIEFLHVSPQNGKVLAEYLAKNCYPATDRRGNSSGPSAEAEITVVSSRTQD